MTDETAVTGGVLYAVTGQVARITIDRPTRLNALDRRAIVDLTSIVARAGADSDVRVVVFTGSGDRAFSVGADLKDMAGASEEDPAGNSRARGTRLFEAILQIGKPTIASLNGLALGAGCEIALACDLRIAADGAGLGLPEARLGLAAMFGSIALPRLLPPAIAARMLFTGETMPASEAARWGLVNQVTTRERLDDAVEELALAVVRSAPLSLARFKNVCLETAGLPLIEALRREVLPDPFTSADRREGVKSFLEKRAPRWTGR